MNGKQIRRLTGAAMLIALELILGFTPLGLIPLGTVSITLLHIPVVIAALAEGLGTGLVVAASFGAISIYRAFSAPGLIDQLFRNPLIAVLPRLMIPLAAAGVFWLIGRFAKEARLRYALAAAAGSVANTVFTVGALSIAIVISPASVGLAREAAGAFLLGVWGSILLNAALECVASVVIVTAIALALERVRRPIKKSAG
jgi:uncharacterized membrane protein